MSHAPRCSSSTRHASYTSRWRVRRYELDANGHVNNAVFLNYAEELATDHAESMGLGAEWTRQHGGTWVIHTHAVTYHRPACYGDELEGTTCVEDVRGARGIRHTTISRVADGVLIADLMTEWVWIRLDNGRPARVPPEVSAALQRAPDPAFSPYR